MRHFSWLALYVFLLAPGHPLSPLGGLPWGPLGLACAVIIGASLFAAWPLESLELGPRRGAALKWTMLSLLLVTGLKLALWAGAPRYGLDASYYANQFFNGVAESSTITRSSRSTRVDPALDFGTDEFPLYFFNDSERFNSNGPDRLDRGRSLTWSAGWSGYLNAPSDRRATIWLTASGTGELALDGAKLLEVDAEGRA